MYNVLTQPSLVIVRNDEDGTVINYDGKMDLLECGYFALIEWRAMYKKILQDIKEGKDKKKPAPKPISPPEEPPAVAPAKTQWRIKQVFSLQRQRVFTYLLFTHLVKVCHLKRLKNLIKISTLCNVHFKYHNVLFHAYPTQLTIIISPL